MANWTIEEEHQIAVSMTIEEWLSQPDVLPWEKFPHESAKAWRAFAVYRDAGRKRSQAYVRGQGVPMANDWPLTYKWTIRVRLYDEYILAEEQIEQLKINREVRARHADQASTALDGLMAPFREFQRRFEEAPEQLDAELADMPAAKLMNTMQASARVLQPMMSAERLSNELPTEMVETTVQGQITVQDSPEALIETLSILEETGIGAVLFGTGPIIEVVDTSDEQVGQDGPTSETDSLPSSTP